MSGECIDVAIEAGRSSRSERQVRPALPLDRNIGILISTFEGLLIFPVIDWMRSRAFYDRKRSRRQLSASMASPRRLR